MAKYIAGIEMKNDGEFDSFGETFKHFFTRILELIKQGTTWQVLETMNYIQYELPIANGGPVLCAIDFYTARDLAYDLGILVGEGELADPLPPDNDQLINNAFLDSMATQPMIGSDRIIEMYANTVGIPEALNN